MRQLLGNKAFALMALDKIVKEMLKSLLVMEDGFYADMFTVLIFFSHFLFLPPRTPHTPFSFKLKN